MKRYSMLALALSSALMLSACLGDGDDGPGVQAANADAQVPASATSTAAVTNVPFTFDSGVPQFGTAAATTLTFTSSSSTPAFSIASGGNTATGTTTFGSCIFTVTQSTFVAPSPLVVGAVIPVHPCEIKLDTSGQVANGQAQQSAVELVLSTLVSTEVAVNVTISTSGQITLNGQSLGSVTLAPVTGS